MSIDTRTRLRKDMRDLDRDEVFDSVLPTAIGVHGDLAARGVAYKTLPSLGLHTDGRGATLRERDGALVLEPGVDDVGVVAELPADALSDLVQPTTDVSPELRNRCAIVLALLGRPGEAAALYQVPDLAPDGATTDVVKRARKAASVVAPSGARSGTW